jgi:hypothetical protein
MKFPFQLTGIMKLRAATYILLTLWLGISCHKSPEPVKPVSCRDVKLSEAGDGLAQFNIQLCVLHHKLI